MNESFNLPSIEDFRKNGKFYRLNLKKNYILPPELYRYIFPDFARHMFQTQDAPKKQTIIKMYNYCLSLKKEVSKEERMLKKKLVQEYEMKQLEEKIKEYYVNYYENKYKNCTCNKK